jgi:hypothetical protein
VQRARTDTETDAQADPGSDRTSDTDADRATIPDAGADADTKTDADPASLHASRCDSEPDRIRARGITFPICAGIADGDHRSRLDRQSPVGRPTTPGL